MCISNVSLSVCSSYRVVFVKARKAPVEIFAVYEGGTKWRKAAPITVTLHTKTVSAEALAFGTRPQEDGLGTRSKSGTT